MYQKQVEMLKNAGHTCNQNDFEKMTEFQRTCVMENSYPSDRDALCLEFSTKYLASLSDTEFMDLLKNTGKVSEEQEKSLTRKYKDIDLEREYMTHSQWDKISTDQSLATNVKKEMDKGD